MKLTKSVYDGSIRKGCLLLCVIILCTGCKKWLEKKPISTLATPESLTDLQALLNQNLYFNNQVTPCIPEASSDDYFLSPTSANNLERPYMAPYLWEEYSYNNQNDWGPCYTAVYTSNLCLEQLNNIPIDDYNHKEWNNVKGSALFFRAYFFLQLAWEYAKTYDQNSADKDFGIPIRLHSDINEPSIRASVRQTYDQIIGDAIQAIDYLPVTSTHCLRPSKAAAYGLLARTYLSMRQYDSTLKYANLALAINQNLMDYNGDSEINADISLDFPFRRFNKEVIFYSEMNGNSIISGAARVALIDTTLYHSYSNDDLRKIAFFRPAGAYQVFKGNYGENISYLFSGITTPEILLMKAECMSRIGGINHTGDKDSAIDLLNRLLVKRYKTNSFIPLSAITNKEALDKVLAERRKELLMRGLRWMDLKRLNKENISIIPKRDVGGKIYELPPNDNRYALPLPQQIVNLTGMPQNPR